MSLDETCLSNGDVYTILTNKAAHGRKGALAAMVRGVASDVVSAVLKKIPFSMRLKVKTITTDLSSAMMLTARNAFPAASLINDRFHVQHSFLRLLTSCAYVIGGKCLKQRIKQSENTVPNVKMQKRKKNVSLSGNGNPRE